jgi:high-affinity iron transporter
MLLNSVIIVLREALEAALLISILSALSSVFGMSRGWIGWSLGLGLAGAGCYSLGIYTISDWFDGVGQEVTSAAIQGVIYLLLLLVTFSLLAGTRGNPRYPGKTVLVMVTIVALAVTREGFEVGVYVHGFTGVLSQFLAILTGAVIGAGIGISIGVLIYYFVISLEFRHSIIVGFGLLALIAAGLISQAALLLIQADWLPSQHPLWDTSGWLPENTVTGQLLYALVGYEATPTPIQAAIYFGGALLMLVTAVLSHRTGQQRN